VNDALSLLWVRSPERVERAGGEGGSDGRWCGFAWCDAVGEEDAILARELLEGDGDEAAYATNYEDLVRVSWGWGNYALEAVRVVSLAWTLLQAYQDNMRWQNTAEASTMGSVMRLG
jgi:hypothetical protein